MFAVRQLVRQEPIKKLICNEYNLPRCYHVGRFLSNVGLSLTNKNFPWITQPKHPNTTPSHQSLPRNPPFSYLE
nr:MAG TPA: hypothetical protein [Caudoviricetes sp.]